MHFAHCCQLCLRCKCFLPIEIPIIMVKAYCTCLLPSFSSTTTINNENKNNNNTTNNNDAATTTITKIRGWFFLHPDRVKNCMPCCETPQRESLCMWFWIRYCEFHSMKHLREKHYNVLRYYETAQGVGFYMVWNFQCHICVRKHLANQCRMVVSQYRQL